MTASGKKITGIAFEIDIYGIDCMIPINFSIKLLKNVKMFVIKILF